MPRTEIKVGDIGTVYFVPTYDNDLTPANFDPSLATTKQIVFKMPGTSELITRDATAAQQDTLAGASIWGLRYVVTAADVAAYSSPTVGGFHQAVGPVKLEGHVVFSASQKWTSQTMTEDQQGRELKVVARLS